ncbi:MAG: Sortase (surface protein transpeptidase) [uncultured Rubrobacteraceae bacterium]|uniref:Sortase (Surface protein transpeptidase) n=1 Tax=uncultured Rubrobacteraceae bacterium TaxID=349277 RepID=A0A6J4NHV9_9ACTN|nr:MAG: Sortase (surface protein transpeptidase) [uncultured Rubrobacteraceae bacterium]
MSLLLVGIGLAVAITFFAGSPVSRAGAADNPQPVSQKTKEGPEKAVVSTGIDESLEKKAPARPAVERKEAPRLRVVKGPEDESLKVTIPAMGRIQNARVPYADGGNDAAFKRYAGVHLRGTGHPWEREANVYIAGHRLGYPRTDSFLAFWDLNVVENGDKVFLTDADGKRYVYKVFKKFVVEPTQVSVTQPLEGRNIVTLQTCTLPDYSRRLIVQAEKVA